MQKLMRALCGRIGNNRGSTLLIAVVLAVIMAIAGTGFLLVTTNSINNDSDAYTRDKAFYAAESGALIAAKYIMSRTYNNWPAANPSTFLSNQNINGLYVTVTLCKNTGLKQDTVKSAAFTSSTTQDASTFKRRVVIVIQSDT
jgi:flagellar basal body rod protein FlgG